MPDIICGICSAQTLPAAFGFLANVNVTAWWFPGWVFFSFVLFFYSRKEDGGVTSVERVCVCPITHFSGGPAFTAVTDR